MFVQSTEAVVSVLSEISELVLVNVGASSISSANILALASAPGSLSSDVNSMYALLISVPCEIVTSLNRSPTILSFFQ